MDQHEFTALQVTLLVRTQPGGGGEIGEFFDSVQFQYQFQDAIGSLLKEQLQLAAVGFEEVMVSLDAPSQRAKKITKKKSSLLGRLFGSI